MLTFLTDISSHSLLQLSTSLLEENYKLTKYSKNMAFGLFFPLSRLSKLLRDPTRGHRLFCILKNYIRILSGSAGEFSINKNNQVESQNPELTIQKWL